MNAERPNFAKQVKKGDILVSGKNFGCGSSRPASKNLIDLGISCILAESVSALFYRNAINMGLPVLYQQKISDIFSEGDVAQVELYTGKITNITTGLVCQILPIPNILMDIIEEGGIIEILKQEAK
jgi:3-isopropylmalate/(R)-2-methylmalate dehydratase small subunit